ncbi:hypothetical protein ASD00_32100 [Ensifer sp. Root31]|uniref:hypothetical protein n=1 Tax=Ensifer sp. Root31 TaxID=1736512 RepID=UPI00070BE785|nr:hypothetical protein [Ensifer sp. Root31]KQU85635.1 hypothetical protein ASD00_32100 [Ensifer sp. Root31]
MPILPGRDTFDHIGLITDQEQPDETWVEENRLWITNPRQHPYHVEFLRYAEDSPAPLALRTKPHVAYRTTDIEAAIEGHKVVQPPFDPSGVGFVKVAFIEVGDALIEFMQYRDPHEAGWF